MADFYAWCYWGGWSWGGASPAKVSSFATTASAPNLLGTLAKQVGGLRARAAQGDKTAEQAVFSMLDGQGVRVLMALRQAPEQDNRH